MIVCWTDMPRPDVLILGNSHAAALFGAASALAQTPSFTDKERSAYP